MIAILVPVLARPQNAQPLVDSIRHSSLERYRILFLCSPFDEAEWKACEATGCETIIVSWEAGSGDWAKKINFGVRHTDEDFVLLGADDLLFHPGWDEQVLSVAEDTGAGVIGTNDLGNAMVMRGRHSTHPLVRRSYIEEYGTLDGPGQCLYEGYHHQWVDTELVETAKARRQWAFARRSHVEHMHPFWPLRGGGGKKGKMDATYKKALSTSHEDYAIFCQRRPLIVQEKRRVRVDSQR